MKTTLTNKYLSHKETINNFVWRALQIFGKQGITFLIFFLCAKLLTPYDFGVYSYILTVIFVLVMFGDFGISIATSRYVAEYNISNKEKLKSVLFSSGVIIFALTAFATFLTVIFGSLYLKDKYVYVLLLLPMVFLAPMTSLYDGIYRGLSKFKQLAIISLGAGFISIFFVYSLIKSYGLVGALISQNIFYLILLIGLGFGYKEFHFSLNREVIKEIGKYSLIIGSVSALYFLFTRVNTLIMGHYALFSEVGYYELLTKFFLFILLPFTIFSQIIGPKIVSYKKQRVLDLLNKVTLSAFLAGSLLFVCTNTIFLLAVKMFLPEYYVPDFISILRIYSFILITQGAVVIASNGFATYLGHAKLNLRLLYILFPINIIGAILILPHYGLIRFMVFVTIVQVVADICYLFLIRRKILENLVD